MSKPRYETVEVTVADGVAVLALNRPDQRNAVNLTMCRELKAAVEAVNADDSVRAILLKGNGPVFTAGADLKERQGAPTEYVRERRHAGFQLYQAIAASSKPAVAAVHKVCIGAGCEMATSCDFILAAEDTRFRYPEVRVGSVGATQRLPRIVGKQIAKELLFTGRFFDATEARSIGLVNRVLPVEQLQDEAIALVRDIATAPPLTARLVKRCIDLGMETDLARGMEIEKIALEQVLASKEWSEGVAGAVAGMQTGATKPR